MASDKQANTVDAIGEVSDLSSIAGNARNPVNVRSILLGLFGVVLISAVTPFNDFVLNNTNLIGGSLPMVVVFLLFLFAVFINGPLSKMGSRWAFSTGELTVAMLMMLVACVIPASGLMKFWHPTVVGTWKHMNPKPEQFRKLWEYMNLPDWLWATPLKSLPTDSAEIFSARLSDPIIGWFWDRIPPESSGGAAFWPTFVQVIRAWMPPVLSWGVFFVGLFGSTLGLSFLLRKQWVENERIAFPIAQVQAALVEAPDKGRYFSNTLSSPAFWIAVGLILFLRILEGLNKYIPEIPVIALKFDFTTLMADPPFSYIESHVRGAMIFPLVAAISFFAASRITFSLWVFMILWQVPCVVMGATGAELPADARKDINLGALIAFAMVIVWTGREHFLNVIRRMFTSTKDDGLFLADRWAGWMALLGAVVCVAWLYYLKMSLFGAILLVGGLLITWVIMAYVVAQSGYISAFTLTGPREWFVQLYPNVGARDGLSNLSHVTNHFWVQTIGGMFVYSPDQLGVYTTHGLKVATDNARQAGRRLFKWVAIALVVAFVVGHLSTLFCYYSFYQSLDKNPDNPINREVLEGQPSWTMGHTLRMQTEGVVQTGKPAWHTPWVGGSMAATLFMGAMQLRYSWWPLHPIGLVMLMAFSTKRLWFSVFLGWLAQKGIVKFGGAPLFKAARPFFLGIIIGEVMAAALFAALSVVLWLAGVPFETVRFVPKSMF